MGPIQKTYPWAFGVTDRHWDLPIVVAVPDASESR